MNKATKMAPLPPEVQERIAQLEQRKPEQQQAKEQKERVKESWSTFLTWFRALNSADQLGAARWLMEWAARECEDDQ